MWSNAKEIAAGDLVIVWMTRDLIQSITITPGKDMNNRFGHYRHSDLIGLPFGSKVQSRTGKGFIYLLRPTPELWTMALPHRTQILYLADIAFITSYLDIREGSCVIEAGTGSGSFSHSVIRSVGNTGHLWSYEFHETRATKAREEFTLHGFADKVTLTHRNVCKEGFTIIDKADAVFLDIPAPWDAIQHAKVALRKDRITRICCFSPCIEQVLRTVTALNEAGFTDITMYETLLRPHDVTQAPVLKPIGPVSEKLKQAERRREEKRLRQIAANNVSKRKRETEREDDDDVESESAEASSSKRVKTEADAEAEIDVNEEDVASIAPGTDLDRPGPDLQQVAREPETVAKITLSKVLSEVRGHTSYLTFACLLPQRPSQPSKETTDAPIEPRDVAIGCESIPQNA